MINSVVDPKRIRIRNTFWIRIRNKNEMTHILILTVYGFTVLYRKWLRTSTFRCFSAFFYFMFYCIFLLEKNQNMTKLSGQQSNSSIKKAKLLLKKLFVEKLC